MTITKREFSAIDAQQVILYGKLDGNSTTAYPIIAASSGGLLINNGLMIPLHDTQVIDESLPSFTTITMKLNNVTVGIKTIAVTGTTTTIQVVLM
jgi:hypothetical protein